MQQSKNYGFPMPEGSDYVIVSELSEAIRGIDGQLKARQNAQEEHERSGSIHRSITWQTVSLLASGWSGNQQTVSVTGISASGSGLVRPAPAAGESFAAYTEAGIRALPIQADGQLIFQCESVPSVNISVVVEVVS